MADGRGARQALDDFATGEGIADQAQAALGVEALAVENDDAGGFLAAVLKRMEAEGGDCRGIRMTENAEHAAFFAERVAIKVLVDEVGLQVGLIKIGLVKIGPVPAFRVGVAGWGLYLVHCASPCWA